MPQSFNFYLARQTSEWQVPNEKIVEMHYVPLVSKIHNYFIFIFIKLIPFGGHIVTEKTRCRTLSYKLDYTIGVHPKPMP